MSNPRFSVVIPTHNGEAYLAAALESLLGQTYPDFEVIVLEHESTDGTLEIARRYADPRIRIHSTSQPHTIETNWARMLDLELAEYLTILGHDDIFYPEFLEEIAGLIAQAPDSSLYLTHFHLIDSNGKVIRPCKPTPSYESAEEFMQARQHFRRDSFATGYVMRSADYKHIGGFKPFPRLIYADDFAFYSLAALSGKTCSSRYLFGYRSHQKSEGYLADLTTLVEASQQYMDALQQTPYGQNPANLRLAHDYVHKTFVRRYIRILINLMQTSDRAKGVEYSIIYKDFRRRFPQHRFSVYDLLVRVVETLLYLRLKPVSRVLNYIVKAARGIKD
jgi:glycosyltransferase involved in cell wall biosynthesis